MDKNTFRWRAFVSFLLALSFLLGALSGIVLFLRPEGGLAAWSGWSALGLDKGEWEAAHAAAILLFLLAAVAHLAFNWRALLAYLRPRREGSRAAGPRLEPTLALLLVLLLLAGTLGEWPPLRWIRGLRAAFKSGAGTVRVLPPVADAQNRTLGELALRLGGGVDRLLAAARAAGLQVEGPGQTLAEVAERNGLSPEEAFIRLSGRK